MNLKPSTKEELRKWIEQYADVANVRKKTLIQRMFGLQLPNKIGITQFYFQFLPRSWKFIYEHGEPNDWDVTLIHDMSFLFYRVPHIDRDSRVSTFNASIGRWDVSKVTTMEGK